MWFIVFLNTTGYYVIMDFNFLSCSNCLLKQKTIYWIIKQPNRNQSGDENYQQLDGKHLFQQHDIQSG
jgi:hypothetical protein